jgi:hypothetical protein
MSLGLGLLLRSRGRLALIATSMILVPSAASAALGTVGEPWVAGLLITPVTTQRMSPHSTPIVPWQGKLRIGTTTVSGWGLTSGPVAVPSG